MAYIGPTGIKNSFGMRFWKGTDSCCDVLGAGLDDAAYIVSLIDEASKYVNIDQKRVFLDGHSNGAFLANRVACDYADRIAGIIALGGLGYKDKSKCKPKYPVNILNVHGTSDETIFYAGGIIMGASYPSVEENIKNWA